MAILKRSKADPARAELAEVLARKAALETQLERLRAGRHDANERLGAATMKLRAAEKAFDEAFESLGKATVEALSAGRPAPTGPDADKLRGEIGAAEAEKRGYAATVQHLSTEIAAIEDRLTSFPFTVDRAIAACCDRLVRQTLDRLHAARTRALQAEAELRTLFDKKYIPDSMGAEVAAAIGLAIAPPQGDPRSPVRAPDLSRLTAALESLRTNADAPLED